MMSKDFSAGDRVKVSTDYHWAKGAIGTVMQPHDFIVNMSDGWEGVYRKVSSLQGMLTFYWISFDEGQIDADGDGPYAEAEIDSNYLHSIEFQN